MEPPHRVLIVTFGDKADGVHPGHYFSGAAIDCKPLFLRQQQGKGKGRKGKGKGSSSSSSSSTSWDSAAAPERRPPVYLPGATEAELLAQADVPAVLRVVELALSRAGSTALLLSCAWGCHRSPWMAAVLAAAVEVQRPQARLRLLHLREEERAHSREVTLQAARSWLRGEAAPLLAAPRWYQAPSLEAGYRLLASMQAGKKKHTHTHAETHTQALTRTQRH